MPAIDWAHYKNQIEAPGFVDFLKQRYEAIDWASAVSTKLSEAEVAADRAEKDALVRGGERLCPCLTDNVTDGASAPPRLHFPFTIRVWSRCMPYSH